MTEKSAIHININIMRKLYYNSCTMADNANAVEDKIISVPILSLLAKVIIMKRKGTNKVRLKMGA